MQVAPTEKKHSSTNTQPQTQASNTGQTPPAASSVPPGGRDAPVTDPVTPVEGTGKEDVKVGDHSIITSSVTTELLIEDITTQQASPNFVQKYGSSMRGSGEIQDINHAISLISYLNQSAPGGGLRPAVQISGRTIPYHIGRIPNDNRHTQQVIFMAAVEKSVFERPTLERLYNAGVPSEQLISSALQPTLHTVNNSLIRNISGCIEQNWEVYNNSALYVKLIYWALVRDCFTYIHSEPAAVPFPPGFDPVWLDLDNPNPIVADYINAINNKSIILVEGVDYDTADWQLVYWLAKSGSQLDGPDDVQGHVLHNTYVNWPGINVTVLAHGPAPPSPQPVVLTSSFMTFVEKLASKRCEWDDFTRGLYIVLDLIGLRYTNYQADYYPPNELTTNYS
jgi:hypothetical protein